MAYTTSVPAPGSVPATGTAAATREFMIPKSTEREYLSEGGFYSVNRVAYEGCREYTAESVLTFGDDTGGSLAGDPTKALPALPATGSELQLRLASIIDSEVAAAGDSVEATLVRAVRASDGSKIAAGTVLRGHLTQLKRAYIPKRELRVGIRFDTIVLNGAPVVLRLAPIGEGDVHDNAIFHFPGIKKIVLGKKFVTQWRALANRDDK
jgi:hypothetical protein